MKTTRLEAFSDGVIAIIITVMVLEMKVPHGARWADLAPLWPVLLSYVLSFANVGIYWNNHHHMLHAAQAITGPVMWANLHFLFWLSLMPFATGWVGENHFAPLPMAVYGVDLAMCAIAYTILQAVFVRVPGNKLLERAVRQNLKEWGSLLAYLAAIPLAFVHVAISGALYVGVALAWFIPDPRIEKEIEGKK